MADIEAIALASDAATLSSSALGEEVEDAAKAEERNSAITENELIAVRRLDSAIAEILEAATVIQQRRSGGKVVHSFDPELLVSLGWIERIQPLARETLHLFLERGWMDEGIWD